MNIDKVGDKLVEQFVDAGLVKSYSDFYKIKLSQLLELERQGDKSAENIIKSIDGSKRPPLARFIYGLGIRFVGEQTAKIVAQHFRSIEKVLAAEESVLISLDGVGDKVAHSLARSLKAGHLKSEIVKLQKLGVEIQNPAKPATTGALAGKTFVITGTLPMDRDAIKDLVESHGGKCLSSVSKKTQFVLAGESAGSKLDKARELEVQVIDWDEFNRMLR